MKWKFTTANYLLTTTPEIEYVFVTAPESGLFFLGLEAWPAETVDMPSGADKRTPMSTAVLELLHARNDACRGHGLLAAAEIPLIRTTYEPGAEHKCSVERLLRLYGSVCVR